MLLPIHVPPLYKCILTNLTAKLSNIICNQHITTKNKKFVFFTLLFYFFTILQNIIGLNALLLMLFLGDFY